MTDTLLQRQRSHTQEVRRTPAFSRQVGEKPVEAAQRLNGLTTIETGLQMYFIPVALLHDSGLHSDWSAADTFTMS